MSSLELPTADRRRFLVAGASLTAALVGVGTTAGADQDPPPRPIELPEWLDPTERKSPGPFNPDPPADRVGFAVVGLGRLALEEILPAFGRCRHARPVALVTGDLDKGHRVARQYGLAPASVYGYRDFERLKDNPAVQVVYVVLPNSMHHEFTLRAAAAGKHVLCEKPMANTSRECEEMIAACKAAHRKLMVAYRMQYEPHHRWLIRQARSGAFGGLKYLQAENGQNEAQAETWRHKKAMAGGGSLPDVGLYCLSFCRYITGEEPVEVSARAFSTPNDPRFREVEESVLFQLRFPSGVLASCATGYGHHTVRRCRVVGETGWAGMEPAFAYKGLRLTTKRADGKADLVTEHDLGQEDQFAIEMDHMARCVLDDKVPHTPGEEGLQDQRLMEAIYRSAAENAPVALPAVAGRDVFRGPAPTT